MEMYLTNDHFISNLIEAYFISCYDKDTLSEKASVFRRYILDDIYLMQKLTIVRKIIPEFDEKFVKLISFLNDTRNSLAHNLFPEAKIKYKDRKISYKGSDIYRLEGL